MSQDKLKTLRDAITMQDWSAGLELSELLLTESGESTDTVYETLLFRARALEHLDKCEEAQACYRLAIHESPQRHEAFLDWIIASERRGDRRLSQRVMESGLNHAAEKTELNMLQTSVLDRPTISVCMIVKNEEKFLANCLTSIRDIADEIILVDTGSDDQTVAIAESFGCKVFHQPWEGNFSKHRNYSIDQATGDWILIIDADEELIQEDIPALREAVTQDTGALLSLTVYNVGERSGKGTSFLPSVRMFRRDLNLRYEGIVHNRLNYSIDTPELRCPVGIRHYGYDLEADKMRAKHERSKTLLLAQLEENPDDAFAHFNIAQLLRAASNFDTDEAAEEVLSHANRAISLTDPSNPRDRSIHLMAHHQATTALYALKRFDEAESIALKALSLKPDYLDVVITLGYICMQVDRLDEADLRFQEYLALQERFSEHSVTDGIIVVHFKSRHNAFYNRGLMAEMRGDSSAALSHYEAGIAECDAYLDAYGRIGWLHLHNGRTEQAEKCFKKQRAADGTVDNSYTGLAQIFNDRGETDAALAELRSGLDKVNNSRALYGSIVQIQIEVKAFEDALRTIADGIRKHPDFGSLYSLLGDVQNFLKRPEEAAQNYQKAENLSPGEAQTALGMANALLLSGDNLGAVRWFQVTLERDPYSAQAQRNLAISLVKLGRHEEAVGYLQSYVEVAADDTETRTILGALYLEMGRGREALAIYEELLKDNPNDPTALLALSDCYLALGSADSATIGYQRLLAGDPEHQIARERLEALGVSVGI